jgi:peptidyl-prolyl cis-trans isomerase SurA
VTIGEFVEHLRRTAPRPGGAQYDQILAEAERFLNSRAIDASVATLPERDPEFRTMLGQYEDGVLLFKISEDSVWARASSDEAGLRAHFAAHSDEYRFPERRRVLAFGTPSDSLLERVRVDLAAGQTPAQILEAYRDSPLTLRLDTVYVVDSTASPLDLTLAFSPGQYTEVVPERSRLAVYLLDGIEAPRAKTFSEARAELVSDYQEVLEAEWVARLRAEYDARTFPRNLAGAFQGPRPAWAAPRTADDASTPTPGGGQ